jgi:hypothetical protein
MSPANDDARKIAFICRAAMLKETMNTRPRLTNLVGLNRLSLAHEKAERYFLVDSQEPRSRQKLTCD